MKSRANWLFFRSGPRNIDLGTLGLTSPTPTLHLLPLLSSSAASCSHRGDGGQEVCARRKHRLFIFPPHVANSEIRGSSSDGLINPIKSIVSSRERRALDVCVCQRPRKVIKNRLTTHSRFHPKCQRAVIKAVYPSEISFFFSFSGSFTQMCCRFALY